MPIYLCGMGTGEDDYTHQYLPQHTSVACEYAVEIDLEGFKPIIYNHHIVTLGKCWLQELMN